MWAIVNTKVSFFVGNVRRAKFWKDRWYGNGPLCASFPSLYTLASSKEAWVVDLWN